MTSSAEKILEEALALPDDERRVLAERLLDTVLRDEPESVAKAWTDEAVRRAGALERGEIEALDGDNAVADLEVKLRDIHGG